MRAVLLKFEALLAGPDADQFEGGAAGAGWLDLIALWLG
jgi:hypothetical protein